MRVLKFGGTSLANPERFMQAAEIIEKAHLADQAAGVLSAPAKITNHLVAIVDKAIAVNHFNLTFPKLPRFSTTSLTAYMLQIITLLKKHC